MRSKKSWFLLTLLILVILTSAACMTPGLLGDVHDDLKKSFQVEPGGKLTLDSDLGSIEVAPGTGNTVDIQIGRNMKANSKEDAEEILKDMSFEIHQEGKNVFVTTKSNRGSLLGSNWRNRIQLKFMITVPSKYDLDLKTAGGSIKVSNLEGSVVAYTSGGSLHFGQIAGPVTAHTSGGSIHLDGGKGSVSVETSGGSINIGKVAGSVKAQTSGGSISVDEVMGTIQASTSGGSISATISKQPEADCKLDTSGGSVHVKLSRDLNLNLVAKCGGGSISTDIPLNVQGKISKSQLEAKLNNGGPQLYLHTSGGGISISELK